jgi:hypothetical protein
VSREKTASPAGGARLSAEIAAASAGHHERQHRQRNAISRSSPPGMSVGDRRLANGGGGAGYVAIRAMISLEHESDVQDKGDGKAKCDCEHSCVHIGSTVPRCAKLPRGGKEPDRWGAIGQAPQGQRRRRGACAAARVTDGVRRCFCQRIVTKFVAAVRLSNASLRRSALYDLSRSMIRRRRGSGVRLYHVVE